MIDSCIQWIAATLPSHLVTKTTLYIFFNLVFHKYLSSYELLNVLIHIFSPRNIRYVIRKICSFWNSSNSFQKGFRKSDVTFTRPYAVRTFWTVLVPFARHISAGYINVFETGKNTLIEKLIILIQITFAVRKKLAACFLFAAVNDELMVSNWVLQATLAPQRCHN